MATPCQFTVFKNHPEMSHYLSFLNIWIIARKIANFAARIRILNFYFSNEIGEDFCVDWLLTFDEKFEYFSFLKVIDFMVDFRHENSNVWKWDNLIDLQPQWVDFNGKRALNIFFWESLSPLLLSPHEALGHKFWLKGGEREKKILGDTGSLSISLGQNITRKPWIIENMTWKN